MKWSYKLGEFLGIRVQLHVTFLLLLAWVAISAFADTGSLPIVLVSVLFVLALFGFVVMHEYGHALTARAFGIQTRRITLYPIGGVAMLERMPSSPKQQLLVALAGPAVNFALAGLIALLMVLLGSAPSGFGSIHSGESLLSALFWVNVVMGAFNLLPALPMDGGRVLRAVLSMRMGALRATRVAARVAKVMALGMAGYALFGDGSANFVLLAIAVVVWLLSSAESRVAEAGEEQRIHARAYPTEVFRGVPAGAVDASEPFAGSAHPPQGFVIETEREAPGPPGRGFVVSVVQSPDGRTLRLVRMRRD